MVDASAINSHPERTITRITVETYTNFDLGAVNASRENWVRGRAVRERKRENENEPGNYITYLWDGECKCAARDTR